MMTDAADTPYPVVVLTEPWEPGNVGAAARAMNNVGASQLRLVVRDRAHRERIIAGDARRFATHAAPLLDSAQFYDDLPDALADCVGAFAFSARVGRFRQPRRTLSEACVDMVEEIRGGPIALVFGTEDRGLSTEQLAHATEIVRIPLPGPHPVLNLAQSVLLALWEYARTAQAIDDQLPDARPPIPRAHLHERDGLRADWDALLTRLGYERLGRGTLHEHILSRLLALLDRGGLERDDVSMLRGLARSIERQCDLADGGDAGSAPDPAD